VVRLTGEWRGGDAAVIRVTTVDGGLEVHPE